MYGDVWVNVNCSDVRLVPDPLLSDVGFKYMAEVFVGV